MKKILCAFLLLASFSSLSKLNAQCTVSNPVISNISFVQGATCTITFDVEFDLTSNGGNKFVGLYVYAGSLPSSFYGGVGGNDVPTTATINATPNVLATIQINTDNSTTTTSANYTAKSSSGNPTSFKPSLSFTKVGSAPSRFKIAGVTVTVPDCVNVPIDLKLDVGSTNAASFNNYQCLITGLPFRANDPVLRGQMTCNNPRSFTFSANTRNASTITFSAYSDAARTVLLQAPAGFVYSGYGVSSPTPISTYSNIVLNGTANNNTSFGPFPYQAANGTRNDVYLSIQVSGIVNANSLQISNGCAVLPVSFISFNASRNKENVSITWETAFEQDSKGFNVQRKTTADWKTLSFVTAKGNTSGPASYTYSDLNSEKGISQYRIEQVDQDGKVKYTDIRSVRGLNDAFKISVFPNPSTDGAVNLVFENNSKRNIIISDMSGRTVKQINDVLNSSITIENLQSGFYNIQIVDQKTNELSVQKLVVRKR